jgi:hypothetical protein
MDPSSLRTLLQKHLLFLALFRKLLNDANTNVFYSWTTTVIILAYLLNDAISTAKLTQGGTKIPSYRTICTGSDYGVFQNTASVPFSKDVSRSN